MESDYLGVYALGAEMKCPICGKVYLRSGMDWAYRRPTNKGTTYFCSWGCMRKHDKKNPKKEYVTHGTCGK